MSKNPENKEILGTPETGDWVECDDGILRFIKKDFVPYEKSLQIAEGLLKKYNSAIVAHIKEIQEKYANELSKHKDWRVGLKIGGVEGVDGIRFAKRDAIRPVLKQFSEEDLQRFSGHGISRGLHENILAAFINILENSFIKGDVGHINVHAKGDYGSRTHSDTNADFFIISHADKRLGLFPKNETDKKLLYNKGAWAADAGAFVVNYDFYPIIDELRKMYPYANIVKANELSDFIEKELQQANSKKDNKKE